MKVIQKVEEFMDRATPVALALILLSQVASMLILAVVTLRDGVK